MILESGNDFVQVKEVLRIFLDHVRDKWLQELKSGYSDRVRKISH